MSAEERRESVIRAAFTEFARGGYLGTSTEAIARRVGVSQPYLFRLFPNKQAIFLAVVARCLEETRLSFERAAGALEGEELYHACAVEYQRMLAADPDMLRMQMQMYVAAASAEALGEPEIAEAVRAGWSELWDWLVIRMGADVERTTSFMAFGMLINVLVSMGFPTDHRVWNGFDLVRPE